jgi:hypothetical protein
MSNHPASTGTGTGSGTGHGHDPHGHGHGDGGGDSIAFGKVIAVGVASLAIFALATVWAAVILKRETSQLEKDRGTATPMTRAEHPAEIGIVDQVPFISDHRIDVWRKDNTARLNSYGWVDRARGIAHIPIDKAMEMVANGASPPGAPK